MNGFLADLEWRGLVHQITDPGLEEQLEREPTTAYIGLDPTADSLHVGHLLQLVNLRRFLEHGHRPIALVGGGTGLIGDPSGRSEERNLLSAEELAANVEGIRSNIGQVLDLDRVTVVDNATWLNELRLPDFLRDVGKHFSVNAMIRKESVRTRLEAREQGISFTEFTYMLLQAYDFLQLWDREGCRLQMGGSDQWGNITEGVELIRRLRAGQAFGLTTVLVTRADGSPFRKSEGGETPWLSPKRTSPYAFYQFWVRTDDADVANFLRFFTFLDRDRIAELELATKERPEQREAQRVLASEVTAMVHGEEEAAKARRAAEVLFSEEIAGLDEPTLLAAFAEAPSTSLPRTALDGGLSLVDALAQTGTTASKSEARRKLAERGIYVNNAQVTEPERVLTAADTLHDRYVVLRRGKRDFHLIRFE